MLDDITSIQQYNDRSQLDDTVLRPNILPRVAY